MAEETQETPQENNQEETKQQETAQDGLMPKEAQQEETKNFAEIPEGLDAEIFDPETRTFKEDKVVERLKQKEEEIGKWKKQSADLRRKISKGVDAPSKAEEYAENFVADERFEFVVGDNETDAGKHIHEVMNVLDKFSYEHALPVQTAQDLKNIYLKYAEDVKIIDCRTDEEKKEANAKNVQKQREILGDNADTIIRENYNFFSKYGMFNDAEKKELLGAMNRSATWNTIGQKIRVLFGEGTSRDIPTHGNIATGTLPSDQELATEYYDAKTSDARRMQIIQQRVDAGRTGRLPSPTF